jgi:hypothetical protein
MSSEESEIESSLASFELSSLFYSEFFPCDESFIVKVLLKDLSDILLLRLLSLETGVINPVLGFFYSLSSS